MVSIYLVTFNPCERIYSTYNVTDQLKTALFKANNYCADTVKTARVHVCEEKYDKIRTQDFPHGRNTVSISGLLGNKTHMLQIYYSKYKRFFS